MTHNLTSRRIVAGRFALLAVAPLCLLLGLAPAPALAQHGGGHAVGAHPMGTANPGGMMVPHAPAINPAPPVIRGNFGHPPPEFHGQPRTGLQLGLGGRWWDDHGNVRKLKLNTDQQQHMDEIFETNKPTLINLYTNLQHEEANLGSLSNADLRDETKVFAAIDRVSHARTELEKENAHILLQIRQQLDPKQLETLDKEIANSH